MDEELSTDIVHTIAITVENIEEFRGGVDIYPGDLPYGMWQVFDYAAFETASNARIVPIDKVVSTKNQLLDPKFHAGEKPDPRWTALERMVAAARGELARRPPCKVVASTADGTFYVVDGNATVQVLMLAGWTEVPIQAD